MNTAVDPHVSVWSTGESQRFTREVRRLRALGCQCPLRWDGAMAIPATACERAPGTEFRCAALPPEDHD